MKQDEMATPRTANMVRTKKSKLDWSPFVPARKDQWHLNVAISARCPDEENEVALVNRNLGRSKEPRQWLAL